MKIWLKLTFSLFFRHYVLISFNCGIICSAKKMERRDIRSRIAKEITGSGGKMVDHTDGFVF